MIYELVFDMERIDMSIKAGTNTIFAERSNMDNITSYGVKEGFFDNIIYKDNILEERDWPNVKFYFSSNGSNLESEYLLNSKSWPIIHKKVQVEFEKNGILGVQYLPIQLVDVETNRINNNFVVMNILNFIEGYDLNKSKYIYTEEYDFYSFLPNATYLDTKVCERYDIFRCTKSVSSIYVSENIKNLIQKHNWIGFDFWQQKQT